MGETGKVVFLSCAAQDAGVAQQLAGALRAVGLGVWFERETLRSGHECDPKIRQQIRECALFVPIVSAQTQARHEDYFRLEWHLAEQRSHLIAKGRAFIVPVCVDATTEHEALVPDAFLAVPWSRPASDAKLAQFVARVQQLLAQPLPPSRHSGSAGGTRKPFAPESPAIPDYDLIRQIGRGSYGDVWLARGVTGIYRAVKVVWRERLPGPEPFEREFQGLTEFAAISLGESIQLALLHVGRNDAAGFFYYVMELADDAERGRSIDPERYVPLTLTELRARRGRIAAGDSLQYGVELARVLAGLHARGLVHRDIKPSNVILVNGVPKLADIGLVTPAASARTFVGTDGFVPPEGPGSPAADVYALGKVLYEISTGLDRLEFPQLPSSLTGLADHDALLELNEVILRACDPSPLKRYRDGATLLADLLTLQAGRPVLETARWPMVLAAAVAAALGAGGWFAWKKPAGGPAPETAANPPAASAIAALPAPTGITPAASEKSLVVLPFINVGGDRQQEYFSDGLTEEVLDALARERDLRVVARSSSFAFKGKNATPQEIARMLNVAQLVEGSVQRAGSQVRIHVRLTRAADGFSESLGSFNREVTDVFSLYDEVARAVVGKLTQRTSTGSFATLTKNAAAYDTYLRGRALQTHSMVNYPEAAKFFAQAVALDPNFALAWARLAQVRLHAFRRSYGRGAPEVAEVREYIDRALALQADLPEGLTVRADWMRSVEFDLTAAERDLARAGKIQAPSGDLRMSQMLLARDRGAWPETFRRMAEALDCDPANGEYVNAAGLLFEGRGRYPEADAMFARGLAIHGTGIEFLFTNRTRLRQAWRGGEAVLRLIERAPEGQAGVESARLDALITLGRTDEARALVENMDHGGRVSYEALEALDLKEALRRNAERDYPRVRADYDRGHPVRDVRLAIIHCELALGHRDAALAVLNDWRHEAQAVKTALYRTQDFNLWAYPCYLLLGRTDDAWELLRELEDQGFHQMLDFTHDQARGPAWKDPRIQSLWKRHQAWAAAQPDPTDDPVPPHTTS